MTIRFIPNNIVDRIFSVNPNGRCGGSAYDCEVLKPITDMQTMHCVVALEVINALPDNVVDDAELMVVGHMLQIISAMNEGQTFMTTVGHAPLHAQCEGKMAVGYDVYGDQRMWSAYPHDPKHRSLGYNWINLYPDIQKYIHYHDGSGYVYCGRERRLS